MSAGLAAATAASAAAAGAPAAATTPAYLAENPHAGQGPVLLEIGEDAGALVLTAGPELVGREIEVRRAAAGPGHPPHAAVIPRLLPDGTTVAAAVYSDLPAGRYVLRLLPDGPARPAIVAAGRVTTATWD